MEVTSFTMIRATWFWEISNNIHEKVRLNKDRKKEPRFKQLPIHKNLQHEYHTTNLQKTVRAYPLFRIVNITKTEIIFLQQIQGLAHLIENALSFNVPLCFRGANSDKQKGGVNEIVYLLNHEK